MLTSAFQEGSDIVSDETKDSGKVDEPQLAADEVKEQELEDVSGGAAMQIASPDSAPGQSAINYPN
jgi:hypothetical protein